MNNTKAPEILAQVITRILEDAAFVFSDSLGLSDRPIPAEWKAIGVELSFNGPEKGKMRLWAGSDFCRSVAANMLGLEVPGNEFDAKSIDALKEILNMITGNFLTAYYGCDPVFDLGIPALINATELENETEKIAGIWIMAEGSPVLCVVDIEAKS